MIQFEDLERALAWYESPAYQAILPLRARNSVGEAILVEGVGEHDRAADRVDTLGLRPAARSDRAGTSAP